MNEEQIKQNAKAYADVFGRHMADYYGVKDAFIAGAHSRDEEVKDLEQALACAEDVVDIQRKELDKLRNPWISVEERLPRIGQSCFLANFDKRRCGYGKFCADDGMVTRLERTEGGSTMIYCLHKVTHWMPIPELKA